MTELLAVFARAPVLGKVKTRLSPPLTAEQALALHRALVEDTLDHLNRIERPGIDRLLLLSEPLEDPSALNVPSGWTTTVQATGGLGERLASLFYMGFRSEVTRLVVLGSDSPTVPPEVVHEAFDELEHRKVVLGPAEDGGYYLLGCSEWIPEAVSRHRLGYTGSPPADDECRQSAEAFRLDPHPLVRHRPE